MSTLNKKNVVLSLLLAGPLVASAAPPYTLTVLPGELEGEDMNRAGHIVSPGNPGAVIWSESGIRRLAGVDSKGPSYATGINNRDDIAGTSFYATGNDVAFANIGGVVHNIGAAIPDFMYSTGDAINDLGWVVGTAFFGAGGAETRAYIYRNGNVQVLSTLGGNEAAALAISNRGHVTGFSTLASPARRTRAFLYWDGKMINLGVLPGDGLSVGQDVNDRGEVVGYSGGQTGTRGFVYSNGKMMSVGTLGGRNTVALGINNVDVVVGASSVSGFGPTHGFIYAFGKMIDLNRLVDRRTGWVIFTALKINEAFQILARACKSDGETCRTVRLDPPRGTSNYKIPPFIFENFGQP